MKKYITNAEKWVIYILFDQMFLLSFYSLFLVLKPMTAEISIKKITFLSFQYSKIVLRFFKSNEKTLYRNLDHSILKLEKPNSSHLMFNETNCNIYAKCINSTFVWCLYHNHINTYQMWSPRQIKLYFWLFWQIQSVSISFLMIILIVIYKYSLKAEPK